MDLNVILRTSLLLAAAGIIVCPPDLSRRQSDRTEVHPESLACAILATRLLRGLLFQVGPNDPVTFVLVGSALTVVAGVAAYLPARRGTSVDLVVTLKAE